MRAVLLSTARKQQIGSMHAAARRGIVRTFQTLKMFGDMTVIEHVLVGIARHSRANLWDAQSARAAIVREADRQLREARGLLNLVGIAHLEQVPATDLAYGHRRLVEIARALAVRPRILLLDEPAAGLVAEEVRALAALIRKLKEAGMTILLVEHHMELVLSVSDRITVLDHGAVIADGFRRIFVAMNGSLPPIWGPLMSLLEVRDLHVAYGELEVVRGVSFSVEPGEIVTILGSNGAGKTTMLRSLGGLIRPSGRQRPIRRPRYWRPAGL